jgi:hypothetical protein
VLCAPDSLGLFAPASAGRAVSPVCKGALFDWAAAGPANASNAAAQSAIFEADFMVSPVS